MEIDMTFQVGDKVVHWAYGLGEVIQLDEKRLAGKTTLYYVVKVKDLTLWVPVEEADTRKLRLPTAETEFEGLFNILRGEGEVLSEDRMERRGQLTERLREGSLESICQLIRDLNSFGYKKKLNESDSQILERACKMLLDEWHLSLAIPVPEAQRELDRLLEEGRNLAK